MENNEQEINLAEYLRIIIKNKTIILACFAAGILLGFGTLFFVNSPGIYQSQATVKIAQVKNQYGEMIPIRNAEDFVNETNYYLSSKYPALNVSFVSHKLIKINSAFSDKEQSEKGVIEIMSMILAEEADMKIKTQAEITKLKTSINNLRVYGQQTSALDLKLFELQSQIDSLVPSEIIGQSTVFNKKYLNPLFYLTLGGITGLLAGLMAIFSKEWWDKNKKNIL